MVPKCVQLLLMIGVDTEKCRRRRHSHLLDDNSHVDDTTNTTNHRFWYE
jgi:hypothetical protein